MVSSPVSSFANAEGGPRPTTSNTIAIHADPRPDPFIFRLLVVSVVSLEEHTSNSLPIMRSPRSSAGRNQDGGRSPLAVAGKGS